MENQIIYKMSENLLISVLKENTKYGGATFYHIRRMK